MTILGDNTCDNTSAVGQSGDRKITRALGLAENAFITEIGACIFTSGQNGHFAIYDAGKNYQGDTTIVAFTGFKAVNSAPCDPVISIAAQTLYPTIQGDGGAVQVYTVPGTSYWNVDDFPTWDDPFGAWNSFSGLFAIYIDYYTAEIIGTFRTEGVDFKEAKFQFLRKILRGGAFRKGSMKLISNIYDELASNQIVKSFLFKDLRELYILNRINPPEFVAKCWNT